MGTSKNTELFTEKSNSYAKYRSGYPSELITDIFRPFSNRERVTVADIGAGTGISSRLMAEQGAKVIAVEPNKAMAESAESHPDITFKIAPAEYTTLDDSSVEVVTSFQAFHWFDFKGSLKEFRRILKPGGQLALVWSYWDEKDEFTGRFINLINKASDKYEDKITPYDGFKGYMKKWRIRFLWKLRILPKFKSVKKIQYSYIQELKKDELIGYARSQSFIDHEGESWEELCSEINLLVEKMKTDQVELKYLSTLFLCDPR